MGTCVHCPVHVLPEKAATWSYALCREREDNILTPALDEDGKGYWESVSLSQWAAGEVNVSYAVNGDV